MKIKTIKNCQLMAVGTYSNLSEKKNRTLYKWRKTLKEKNATQQKKAVKV